MQLQLLTFTETTRISIAQQDITFTCIDDTLTSHLVIPGKSLLIININSQETYTYRGLVQLNKYLQQSRSAKWEFDQIGTLNVKLMVDRAKDGHEGVECVEFYFYCTIDDDDD
jgi:hypothetical protein